MIIIDYVKLWNQEYNALQLWLVPVYPRWPFVGEIHCHLVFQISVFSSWTLHETHIQYPDEIFMKSPGKPTKSLYQWPFQDPKFEAPTMYKTGFSCLCKGISQLIKYGLIWYSTDILGTWNAHWPYEIPMKTSISTETKHLFISPPKWSAMVPLNPTPLSPGGLHPWNLAPLVIPGDGTCYSIG